MRPSRRMVRSDGEGTVGIRDCPKKILLQKVAKESVCHSRESGPSQAKREIYSFQIVKKAWVPFFKGMTTFCIRIKKGWLKKLPLRRY
jgi:hypothetical protein